MLELLESSEDEDEDDDGTGVDDINGDGRGDKNTNSGGGSTEWLRFLSLRSRMKALGDIAKVKAT